MKSFSFGHKLTKIGLNKLYIQKFSRHESFNPLSINHAKNISYAKDIENSKAQIYNGLSSEEIFDELHKNNDKIPDVVFSSLIDTYFTENKPQEALNILRKVY